jgi:hypothetical protein
MERVSGGPKPVPWDFVVKNAWKILSISAAGNLTPVSVIGNQQLIVLRQLRLDGQLTARVADRLIEQGWHLEQWAHPIDRYY